MWYSPCRFSQNYPPSGLFVGSRGSRGEALWKASLSLLPCWPRVYRLLRCLGPIRFLCPPSLDLVMPNSTTMFLKSFVNSCPADIFAKKVNSSKDVLDRTPFFCNLVGMQLKSAWLRQSWWAPASFNRNSRDNKDWCANFSSINCFFFLSRRFFPLFITPCPPFFVHLINSKNPLGSHRIFINEPPLFLFSLLKKTWATRTSRFTDSMSVRL